MLQTSLQLNYLQYTSGSVLRFSLQKHGQPPKSFYFGRHSSATRAAFFPDDDKEPHPLFPNGVDALTMFADYRVRRRDW